MIGVLYNTGRESSAASYGKMVPGSTSEQPVSPAHDRKSALLNSELYLCESCCRINMNLRQYNLLPMKVCKEHSLPDALQIALLGRG